MSDDTAAARRKRLENMRIANIQAHANAVPPTPDYLAAKADLLAKHDRRTTA